MKITKTILALGADIKNRILLAKGNVFYFGQDIGDLNQAKNFANFKKEARRALKISRPQLIACDLHPNYFSSLWAKTFKPSTFNFKLLPIQHHHAHIASVMQEHNLQCSVLGVAFDGTGYGLDGNFWGGEFLLIQKTGFKRAAHLKYQMMPGADKAVLEPWRMVLAILKRRAFPFLKRINRKDKELILMMLAKNINSPLTSSAGRLFDAAAALLGICLHASYEAECPIRLERMCDVQTTGHYRFEIIRQGSSYSINTDGLFLGMLEDLKKKEDKRIVATKFHNSIIQIIVQTIKILSRRLRIKNVVLSGGVFQNNFLRAKTVERLAAGGFKVFINQHTPVNDLNISLGQYYISRYIDIKRVSGHQNISR